MQYYLLSGQLPSEVEWFVIIQANPYGSRPDANAQLGSW